MAFKSIKAAVANVRKQQAAPGYRCILVYKSNYETWREELIQAVDTNVYQLTEVPWPGTNKIQIGVKK